MIAVSLVLLLVLIGFLWKIRPIVEFAQGHLSRPDDQKRRNRLRSMGEDQFIELSFGRVHYIYRSGSSSSKTLNVFVHGFSTPMQMWQKILPAFVEDDQPCLVFDLYGRGWSDAPALPMTVDLFVSQLTELLYALNLPYSTYNLFGVSMGGVIVQRFAQLYPSRVAKLILCCSAGLKVVQPPKYLLALLSFPFLGPMMFKRIMQQTDSPTVRAQWTYPDRQDFREIQDLFQETCREHPGFLRSLYDTVRQFDFQSIQRPIANFHRPILILWGDRDSLIPVENAYRYKELYPHASLKIIPNANHSLLIEHAEECVEAMRSFLSRND